MIRFVLALVAAAALAALYFTAVLNWSYSTGERAGWVQKFSNKGWVCKTWEGELALVSLPGSTTEKFFFTVHDDRVAREITRHIGKRVALHYEEKVGLPTSCFGDTRHFVTGVTLAEEIPIGPGVVVPAPSAPSAPAPAQVPPATSAPPPPAVPAAPAAPAVPAAPAAPPAAAAPASPAASR